MAYVAPSNRTTGTLISAAIWNQDVVANPIAIYAGALAVAGQGVGDSLVASSATQFTRISGAAAVLKGQVFG
jgi:hypothetical protein